MVLDLHNIKHKDVVVEIDKFLLYIFKYNKLQIEIITGNSDTMKKIVIDTMNEYNIKQSMVSTTGSLFFDIWI